ncbi:MAG: hypothetical protein JEY97_09105 [Bacteroidales bacterium]|nr:hypothetical protein [Bacteroidales bacterium]
MKNEVNHYDIVKNHMLFKQSGYYVNGLRNGIWYEYWPNDNIRNEANYVKGIILGDFKAFYPNGNLMMKGNICLSKKILVAGFNEQGEFVGEELTDTKIILEYFYLK